MSYWLGNIIRGALGTLVLLSMTAVAGCISDPDAAQPTARTAMNAVPPDPSVLNSNGGVGSPAASISQNPSSGPQINNANALTGQSSASSAMFNGNAPPAVNVFGEFNGVERGPVTAHGNGGFQQHTFLDEGYDADVSVDPTGRFLVFTSTRQSEHPNIFLQRVDGLAVIQLTDDESDYANPTFSPDGHKIAFASTRSGIWGIYTMDIDGKNVVQVTNGPMQCVHPSYSPDGGRLVYCALGGRSGQWELWTADLSTGEKRMIGFGLFPSWCPTPGIDRIAFQRPRQRGGRWFSLWTLDLINGESRNVTEVAVSSNAAIVTPTWSPDGRQLAFATILEPSNSTAAKPLGQQDIWMISADGSNRHRLTDGVGMNLGPCWACDGRIYFVSDRAGTECVWSSHSDTQGGQSLTEEFGTSKQPTATPTQAIAPNTANTPSVVPPSAAKVSEVFPKPARSSLSAAPAAPATPVANGDGASSKTTSSAGSSQPDDVAGTSEP